MDIVLLLPGQGSQRVGMGKDLYEAYPAARDAFHAVDEAAGAAISSLAFDGPADGLTKTLNAQPALLAHSAAAWAVVREAVRPSVVAAAGHSLGELSAHYTAGTFDLPDVARVVRRRGTLMYEQGQVVPGAMAAVIGTLREPIEAICGRISAAGALVVPANYNSPEQVVISGEVAGVELAMQACKDAGAKRCLPLPVSGAFHSPLMEPATTGLAQALTEVPMRAPRVPVYANVDATAVTDAATARELLVRQITAPVRWTAVMERLAAAHPQALFVELGAGSVLGGLARRIAPDIRTVSCGTVAEVERLVQQLEAHAH